MSEIQARAEFSHELTREVILGQLQAPRRQPLHLKVAAAIERIYAHSLEDHYASLAQHYATDSQNAARYFYLAGQQAIQSSAHAEAVGHLTSSLGHEADGIAQMEVGLSARRATGAHYPPAQFLGWLAEAYGKTGQATRGLTVLEEALATVHRAGDIVFEAELHRLKGELLLIQDPFNSAEAAHCFQIAIEKSERQGAKSLELRAKTSLARALRKRRCGDQARALLSEIYGWFTEGFDTLDLKDAKALLDELSP